MVETSEPATPPANTVRVFVRDNGASKTQLSVKFPDGTIVNLATQP